MRNLSESRKFSAGHPTNFPSLANHSELHSNGFLRTAPSGITQGNSLFVLCADALTGRRIFLETVMDYIPQSIYRWLPTIYVIAGSLLGAYFPGSKKKPSALLLVWVGVAVFNMRLNNKDQS